MNRQAPGDKAEALTNTHIHEWLREGGTQLEVFRYLVLFLTGFVIGDLFLRAFLHARKSAMRRDTLVRRRGSENTSCCVCIPLPHIKTARTRELGSAARSEVRWGKDQVVIRKAVPDFKDTCVVI
jgi:hypothetical protein